MVQQIVDEYHSLLGFKNYILNFFRQNEMNNGHAKWSLALKGSKGLEDRSGYYFLIILLRSLLCSVPASRSPGTV